MTISNVGIADDDMEIVCEVHWNRRYSDGRNAINVYGKFKRFFISQLR